MDKEIKKKILDSIKNSLIKQRTIQEIVKDLNVSRITAERYLISLELEKVLERVEMKKEKSKANYTYRWWKIREVKDGNPEQ